ncbi:Hypothetical predicted protein [Scomber scombrus]|uniref:Uncharacterized protein n=1 Tax=Scomber scombrus TaxID=13677 RepID=A0AAV1PKV4_SCOSC
MERLLITGTRERLAPPRYASENHRSARRRTAVCVESPPTPTAGVLLTSVCEDPLTLQKREEVGVAKSPVTTPTPDAILLNADHEPALSVCLSVSTCLSVRYISCQSAPSAIALLHSFRLCTDHQQPLMTSSLTMFTCTVKFSSRP